MAAGSASSTSTPNNGDVQDVVVEVDNSSTTSPPSNEDNAGSNVDTAYRDYLHNIRDGGFEGYNSYWEARQAKENARLNNGKRRSSNSNGNSKKGSSSSPKNNGGSSPGKNDDNSGLLLPGLSSPRENNGIDSGGGDDDLEMLALSNRAGSSVPTPAPGDLLDVNNNNKEEEDTAVAVVTSDYNANNDAALALVAESAYRDSEPYRDYNGSDDDANNSPTNGAIELSKRTSDLMDSFRDYVGHNGTNRGMKHHSNKKEGGDGSNRDEEERGALVKSSDFYRDNDDDNGDRSDDKQHRRRYSGQYGSNDDFDWYGNKKIIHNGINGSGTAATAAGNNNANRGGVLEDVEYGERDIDAAEEHYRGIGSARSSGTRGRYRYAWLRWKRVQRAIFMIVLTTVSIAIFVGVRDVKRRQSLTTMENERTQSLTTLENEMREEEDEYKNKYPAGVPPVANGGGKNIDSILAGTPSVLDQMHTGQKHHNHQVAATQSSSALVDKPVAANAIIQSTLTHSSTTATGASSTTTQNTTPQPKNTKEELPNKPNGIEEPINDDGAATNPKWYDHSTGWIGGNGESTYEDALHFCSNYVEARSDVKHELCPYSAYCPEGADSVPYGGGKGEIRRWAPIGDSYNGWVRVGGPDSDALCEKWEGDDGGSEPPEWSRRHIMCCVKLEDEDGDLEVSSSTTTSSSTRATSTEVTSVPVEPIANDGGVVIGTADHDTTHHASPTWYDRSTIWKGRTYDDAIHFCHTLTDGNGNRLQQQHELCSYSAYCPDGPKSIPIGGAKPKKGTWAPVMDSYNDWVQIGAGDDVHYDKLCERYPSSSIGGPEWGLTGENYEGSVNYVMCCMSSASPSFVGGIVPDNEAVVEENQIASSNTQPTGVDDKVMGDNEHYMEFITGGHSKSDSYLAITQRYSPTWHSRSSEGYDVTSYESALLFCAYHDVGIPCPYEAYCPDGPDGEPYGGGYVSVDEDTDEGAQWVPVIDDDGLWIRVSSKNGKGGSLEGLSSCAAEKKPPDWVHNQENKEHMRHVLCCNSGTLDEDALSTHEEGAVQTPLSLLETDVTTVMMEDGLTVDGNDDIAEVWDPRWYDRSTGWAGHTADDAIYFCSNIKEEDGKEREVCPYSVYCPGGPDFQPYGGGKGIIRGWAPIGDSYNAWVQVGGADYDVLCKRYEDLNSEPPEWSRRHIMCCVKSASDMDDEEAVTSSSTSNNIAAVITSPNDGSNEGIIITSSTTTEATKSVVGNGIGSKEGVMSNDPTEAKRLDPKWYNRDDGWLGRTYDEAVDFCSSIVENESQYRLCPYQEMCPNGPHNLPLPYGDYTFVDGSWAPISDTHNNWVQVGVSKTDMLCVTYETFSGGLLPSWGLTGEYDEEFTRHVLCCPAEQTAVVQQWELPK